MIKLEVNKVSSLVRLSEKLLKTIPLNPDELIRLEETIIETKKLIDEYNNSLVSSSKFKQQKLFHD